MQKNIRTPLFLTILLGATACTNLDCPLDNVVVMTCGLYHTGTSDTLMLSDTLTVSTGGMKDTVLLNRATGISDFELQLRQASECDTLQFRFANTSGQSATDTIFLTHINTPHFESVDCPASMFHTLQSVSWTSHSLDDMPLTIDSVAIVRNTVNYEDIENLRIYLRSTGN